MHKNFRFVPVVIAPLELFGALQSHLVHCDRPLAFKLNRSTVEGTRIHIRGEVGLQRMKIQRMISWTAGLCHQFSLMRGIYGHRTRTITTLQNVGGMARWRLKTEWNFNETSPSHLKKRKQEKLYFFFRNFACHQSGQSQIFHSLLIGFISTVAEVSLVIFTY